MHAACPAMHRVSVREVQGEVQGGCARQSYMGGLGRDAAKVVVEHDERFYHVPDGAGGVALQQPGGAPGNPCG